MLTLSLTCYTRGSTLGSGMTKFMGINENARPENRLVLKPTLSGFFDVERLRKFFGMSEYGHYLQRKVFRICIHLISKQR